MKVLAGLQHPNIIGYHTAWTEHVPVSGTQAKQFQIELKVWQTLVHGPNLAYHCFCVSHKLRFLFFTFLNSSKESKEHSVKIIQNLALHSQ